MEYPVKHLESATHSYPEDSDSIPGDEMGRRRQKTAGYPSVFLAFSVNGVGKNGSANAITAIYGLAVKATARASIAINPLTGCRYQTCQL